MKTKTIKAGFAVSALALAVSQGALAGELRFDGFASFVAGQVLDKDELVGANFRGYDEKLGFQNNSRFAVQARADLQDKLTATAQIVAKGANDYEAKFSWAYLTYQLTDEFTIKAGRFRPPLFIYSEFLDVGYAYHWILPPDSVYNLLGFDTADGVMLTHQVDIGGWTSAFSGVINRSTSPIANGSVDSANGWSLTWDVNKDWFTFHIVYSASDTTVNGAFDQLAAGLSQAGVPDQAINNMMMDGDRGTFAGIGFGLDSGSLFAIAEYTELAVEDAYSADPAKRGYVSGGFRTGKWTVFATVENVKAEYDRKALAAISDPLNAKIAALTAALPYLNSTTTPTANEARTSIYGLSTLNGVVTGLFQNNERDENIYSAGVRYNFHPSACAKMEYIQMDDKYRDKEPAAVAMSVDLVF